MPGVEVNRNLFKDENDFHIGFFLHKSIKKESQREKLTRDIVKHGGIVLDTDVGCNTVLVHPMYDKKETLRISYNTENDPRLRKVFVESSNFVQRCIQSNQFMHRIRPLKGMGGYIGKTRVPFTEEDDENLCHYLACILPFKESGGRLGLGVYKELVATAQVKESHAWGDRHTPESWKERYKKNSTRFDARIAEIRDQYGIPPRKQLWHEDRRASRRYLRGKHKYEPEEEEESSEKEESSEEEESSGDEERSQPPRKRQQFDYSPQPPKGRRVVQLSSDQEDRMPSTKKGKARVVEEEEGVAAGELDQLEDHVQDDVLTHRTQPNTASFFTQETLVATAPSGTSVQSMEASHIPSEASSPVRRSMTREASPSRHESLEVIDLTSPSGPTGRDPPIIELSPKPTLVNPSLTQSSTYNRPLKAARRRRVTVKAAIVDAPYKNTRSRSQSVEPYPSNYLVRESKKERKKGARKTIPALTSVDEIQDNDGQDNENLEVADERIDEPVPFPLGELADEVDVENMLISDQDEKPDDVDEARGVSLDTDDAQTEENLRPKPPQQTFSSLRQRPSDMLKDFQQSSVINRPSIPLTTHTARPQLSNTHVVHGRHTQAKPGSFPPSLLSRPFSNTAEPPRTPPKNSASSTDSFPLTGTRASALKKKTKQVEQEKRNPYTPPTGTRAARFARSRRSGDERDTFTR